MDGRTMSAKVSFVVYIVSWRGSPVLWLMRSTIVPPSDAMGSIKSHSGTMEASFVLQEIRGVRVSLDIKRPVPKTVKSYFKCLSD